MKILEQIKKGIEFQQKQIESVKTEIAKTIQKGTTSASIVVRKSVSKRTGEEIQTYYYRWPVGSDGKRKQKYIGRQPYKIKHAQEKIERSQNLERLRRRLEKLEADYNETISRLEWALEIAGKWRLF